MDRFGRRAGALVFALFGCSLDLSPLWTAPPAPAAARIFAFRSGSTSSFVLSAQEGEEPLYLVVEDYPFEIFSYSYERTLEELGLSGGLLPAGRPTRCDLLEGRMVHHAELSGRSAPLWAPVDRGPEAVDDLLVPERARACNKCWGVSLQRLRVVSTLAAFISSTSSSVRIGYLDGSLVEVSQDREVRELCSAQTGRQEASAGTAIGGSAWIAFRDGRIAEFSLADQRAGTACAPRGAELLAPSGIPIALAASPPGEAFELFALSASISGERSSLELARFDGSSWRDRVSVADAPDDQKSSVVRLAPGVGVAAAFAFGLLVIEPGRNRTVMLPPFLPVNPKAESLARDPAADRAVWVGVTGAGPVHFALGTGLWTSLASNLSLRGIEPILPFEDRVLFGINYNQLGQLILGMDSFCELLEIPEVEPGLRTNWWTAAARLGEDQIIIPDLSSTGAGGKQSYDLVSLNLERPQ